MAEVHKGGVLWFFPMFACAIALAIALTGCFSSLKVECKESTDCWTKSVGDLQLRIRKEPLGYMSYTYIFEGRNSSDKWQHLHDYKRNEPIRSPDIQIGVLTSKDGYYFAGPTVAITSDTGETWNVANLQQLARQGCEIVWIERLEVEDGRAKAVVAQNPTRKEKCPNFSSSDFGKTWNRQEHADSIDVVGGEL